MMGNFKGELEVMLNVFCGMHKSFNEELGSIAQKLPKEFFLKEAAEAADTSSGWSTTKDGIVVPERLIKSAKEGTLTKIQIEEIRQIQKEWASQPYEINTKKQQYKKIVTSKGLRVRSKSELMISEKLYGYDVPFRHDQIIRIGQKVFSPDFTFFSIINGEYYWEHVGLTGDEDYKGYHSYKLRVYEGAGIVPWENYIETYDEPDGYFDSRIIDAEIQYKLLRRLQLQ